MKPFSLALIFVFSLFGCSGPPISDGDLGIMKAQPFPTDPTVVQASVDYLSSHPAGDKPLHGIVFASFFHANSGHGECDTPTCWMVQLIGPDGEQLVAHANMPSPKFKVDIALGHHLGYSLNEKALLDAVAGNESFVCLERLAVKKIA